MHIYSRIHARVARENFKNTTLHIREKMPKNNPLYQLHNREKCRPPPPLTCSTKWCAPPTLVTKWRVEGGALDFGYPPPTPINGDKTLHTQLESIVADNRQYTIDDAGVSVIKKKDRKTYKANRQTFMGEFCPLSPLLSSKV